MNESIVKIFPFFISIGITLWFHRYNKTGKQRLLRILHRRQSKYWEDYHKSAENSDDEEDLFEKKIIEKNENIYQNDTYMDNTLISKNNDGAETKHVLFRRDSCSKLLPNIRLDACYLLEVPFLGDRFPSSNISNYIRQSSYSSSGDFVQYNKLIGHEECILGDIVYRLPREPISHVFLRGGPREILHFNPEKVTAAIVTCGGLCPGLNNVIREIYHSLYYLYNAKKVYGIVGGYSGFKNEPIEITLEKVQSIHHEGGTILGTGRGGFDVNIIINFLIKYDINQLYIIGGDGTHRGALEINHECLERNLNISIIGIPKTIDNDIGIIDHSFGFFTSVETAQHAIRSAKTEAKCNYPNGIGIVKLMGRSSGYIAVHATLASSDVDLCIIPEVPLVLEGNRGVLPHLQRRIEEKGHAVVVVAEGAGEELLGESTETDLSGNKKLPAVGYWLKQKVLKYFEGINVPVSVKYIDPSYMIRSIPANANDATYCMLLGQNAVHGAMAGYTGFSVGLVNNRVVYIPIGVICKSSPRKLNPKGRTYERILSRTRQPNPLQIIPEFLTPTGQHLKIIKSNDNIKKIS